MDAVSDLCHCSWDEVWKKDTIEFLTLLSYLKDKAEKDRQEIEEWKKKH